MIKNIIKKIPFIYLSKGYIRFRGKYYFFYKKWFASPSLRQAKVLKSYVTQNKHYKKREVSSSYFLSKIKSSNPIILDIGANLGYSAYHYSKFLKSVGKGSCLSFEPVSNNFSDLIFNFGHVINIFFFRLGLGNETKKIIIGIPSSTNLSDEINTGLYSSKNIHKDGFQEECHVVTVDSILKTFSENQTDLNLEYIKIDVEGSELDVVKGAKATLLLHNPVVQIEYNTRANDENNFKDILNNFKHLNYHPYIESGTITKNGYEVYFISSEVLDNYNKDNFFLSKFELLEK